jgi:hypothetical protein
MTDNKTVVTWENPNIVFRQWKKWYANVEPYLVWRLDGPRRLVLVDARDKSSMRPVAMDTPFHSSRTASDTTTFRFVLGVRKWDSRIQSLTSTAAQDECPDCADFVDRFLPRMAQRAVAFLLTDYKAVVTLAVPVQDDKTEGRHVVLSAPKVKRQIVSPAAGALFSDSKIVDVNRSMMDMNGRTCPQTDLGIHNGDIVSLRFSLAATIDDDNDRLVMHVQWEYSGVFFRRAAAAQAEAAIAATTNHHPLVAGVANLSLDDPMDIVK